MSDTCARCGGHTVPEARFCPNCGAATAAEQPTLSLPAQPSAAGSPAASAAPSAQPSDPLQHAQPIAGPGPLDQPLPEPMPQARRPWQRAGVLAVVGALLLVIVGGAVWALVDSPAEKQLAAATDSLESAFVSLAAAQSTADLRAVGESVSGAADATAEYLADQPAGEQPAGLTEASAALSAIADLDEVAGDNTKPWKTAEPLLRGLVTSSDSSVATLGASAVTAADQVDDVLGEARSEYKKWAKENKAAVAERDAAIDAATHYQSRVESALTEYAGLRNDLQAYIDKVNGSGSTISEAYYEFAAAGQARSSVRDDIAALSPPAAASAPHQRLLRILDDGISAVQAAERALDERECSIYGCDVQSHPAWRQFSAESSRITSALNAAQSDIREAAKEAVAEARAIELPDKPEF